MSVVVKLIKDTFNYDISPIIKSITWSGDIKGCARTLEFSTISSANDINIPSVDIPVSSMIMLFEDGKELFRGFVEKRSRASEGNSMDYICYDFSAKLNHVDDVYTFKNSTPQSASEYILKQYGFNIGSLAKANTKITKIFMGKSLFSIIQSLYTYDSKVSGKKYMIIANQGKINVIEKGVTKLKLRFEEGINIISTSHEESVSDMVNRVIIVDENGTTVGEVKDQNNWNIHGLWQKILKQEEGKDAKKEAQNMLHGLTQTCSLTGFGDTSCITGYGVQVKDTHTGLTGLFYIDSDTHNWEGGKYTIELKLNFKNIMEEVEAGEDEKKEEDKTSTSTTGKEYPAEFTAYYPSNDPMQGGFKSANGETLKPSSLTCACPKEVPFNTKIQVKGTGTSRDGVIYRCNDRGGAIKIVNGVYKIDLLMSNRNEAYSFGRRKGKVIIDIKSESSSTGKASSKAEKAVELAKSKLGKPYVWGATGANSFDCSGLTQWVYKQVGVKIPRTSLDQSKHGKSVSRSQLVPGDLLFFDTMGKGRVSHVGIYIGGGKMVHASNPKSGVKTDNIDSSYYKSKWKGARRVT